MDDYTLEKLSAKPAKLNPAFKSKTFEYTSTVSNNVDKVTIDCLTADTGASYQIKVCEKGDLFSHYLLLKFAHTHSHKSNHTLARQLEVVM